jgi:hypothetical protein
MDSAIDKLRHREEAVDAALRYDGLKFKMVAMRKAAAQHLGRNQDTTDTEGKRVK